MRNEDWYFAWSIAIFASAADAEWMKIALLLLSVGIVVYRNLAKGLKYK